MMEVFTKTPQHYFDNDKFECYLDKHLIVTIYKAIISVVQNKS